MCAIAEDANDTMSDENDTGGTARPGSAFEDTTPPCERGR
jgi:hypothetical protein